MAPKASVKDTEQHKKLGAENRNHHSFMSAPPGHRRGTLEQGTEPVNAELNNPEARKRARV